MDALLDQLSREGVTDSSGAFTLDLVSASRKMATMAKLKPALFLVKMVQAGVVAQARQARVQIGAEEVEVALYLDQEDPTWSELPRLVQGGVQPTNRLGRHVHQALSLAAAQEPGSLLLRVERRQGGYELDLMQGATPRELPDTGKWRVVLRFANRKGAGFWDSLRLALRGRVDYLSELTRRLCFCPIPVYVDAARINAPACDHSSSVHRLHLRRSFDSTSYFAALGPFAVGASRVELDGQAYSKTSSRLICFEVCDNPPAVVEHSKWVDNPRPVEVVRRPGAVPLLNNHDPHVEGDGPPSYCIRWQWDWLNCNAVLARATPVGEEAYLAATCWLSLGGDLAPVLLPIQDGMLMDPVSVPDWPSGSRAVLVFPHQKVDVNLTGVIQDEELQAILRDCKSRLETLAPLP